MGFADVLQGVGQIQNIQSSDSHFQGTSFWKCRVRAAPIAEIYKRSLKQKAAILYYNICGDMMSVRIKGCCKNELQSSGESRSDGKAFCRRLCEWRERTVTTVIFCRGLPLFL